MNPFRIGLVSLAILSCGSLGTPLYADDLDQNLIAKWTFKDGSFASDSGEYVLKAGGRGTMDIKNGSVTFKDAKYLLTPEISSARFPNLTSGVTLWARLRFDELPVDGVVNVLSLQNIPGNGAWSAITFSMIYGASAKSSGFGFLLKSQDEGELGIGPSRIVPVQAGETVNVAIVFDGAKRTGTFWINGKSVSSTRRESVSTRDFAAFGFGQLMAPGAKCTVTFEEVRLYSSALDGAWLEEIIPTKK